MSPKRTYEIKDRQNILSDQKYAEDERIFEQFLASVSKRKRARPKDSDVSQLDLGDVDLLDDVVQLEDTDVEFD